MKGVVWALCSVHTGKWSVQLGVWRKTFDVCGLIYESYGILIIPEPKQHTSDLRLSKY